jgi:hypothetical protein
MGDAALDMTCDGEYLMLALSHFDSRVDLQAVGFDRLVLLSLSIGFNLNFHLVH